MQPTGPKTIRVLAIILASLGGLLFLTNSLLAMAFGAFDIPGKIERAIQRDGTPHPPPHAFFQMMKLMVPVAAITALLSLLLCLGSIFMVSFRQWARVLVCIVLALMLLGVWTLPFVMQPYLQEAMQQMDAERIARHFPIGRLMLAGQVAKAFVYSLPLATVLFLFARKSTGALFHPPGRQPS
ncbi:hypothetical protein E0486_00100 [Flaviaesturariibacter aridisoli]|uniref:Uncharacterized protein n=1 Tax=Flaviaesturariibacter aridisoli TaxID=2545761 RepID=A0A4R4E7F0_9BACT|nr:hypothetical protein E0486_00100 [Flaviaesturariibacter aridisoli]